MCQLLKITMNHKPTWLEEEQIVLPDGTTALQSYDTEGDVLEIFFNDAAANAKPFGNIKNASDNNESASISLNETDITSDKKSIDSQIVDNGKVLTGGIDTIQSSTVKYAHLSPHAMHQNVNAEDLVKTMQNKKEDSHNEAVAPHSPSKTYSQREHNHVKRTRDYDRERSRSPSRGRVYTGKRSRSRSVDRTRNPGKGGRERSRSRSRSRHSRDHERMHYNSRK